MEYLIKTYTKENETVLDFTMGSGTTMVIEMDEGYFNIAQARVNS